MKGNLTADGTAATACKGSYFNVGVGDCEEGLEEGGVEGG